MKKYSKQRELILNSLQNRCDHPTADILYLDLKKEMPNIGIATVYRNLVDLTEEGAILKLKCKNGPDRYDGNICPHIHFECECCGNIVDVFLEKEKMEKINNDIKQLADTMEIQADHLAITMSGKCQKCK